MKESCETAMAARRHTSKKPAVQTDGSEPSAPPDATVEPEAVGTGEPAAASPAVGALPEPDATKLVSDAQLLSLVGKEDQEVEAFWMKCSSRQQQQLWKKFEKKRMEEGSEAAYKDVVKGAGSRKKANTCIKLWLKTGSAKNPVMMQYLAQIKTTQAFTETEEWVPLEKIKKKYGPQELKARVMGGSILVRRSPTDSRFPEFQDLTEKTTKSVEKIKSKTADLSSKASLDDFLSLGAMEVENVNDLHFELDAGEPTEEEMADPKNFALAFLGSSGVSNPKSKGPSVDDALEAFETASALADKDSIPKTQIQKCLKKLQKHLTQLKDKSKPEFVEAIDDSLQALNQISPDTPAGVAKKALNSAATVGKRAFKALDA